MRCAPLNHSARGLLKRHSFVSLPSEQVLSPAFLLCPLTVRAQETRCIRGALQGCAYLPSEAFP